MKKRIISLCMAICLLIAMLPQMAITVNAVSIDTGNTAISDNPTFSYTVGEIEQLVADYYNANMADDAYPGTYVVFSSETRVKENMCYIVVRFQGTSATTSNIFIADVSVDMSTGEITINGVSHGFLWAKPSSSQYNTPTGKLLTEVKIYKTSGELITHYTFRYNSDNLLEEVIGTHIDSDSETKQELEYDSAGRLISNVFVSPDGFEWAGTEYTYNDHGKLISMLSWEGGAGEVVYEYDSSGKLIRATESYDTASVVTDYTYGADGLLKSSTDTTTEYWNDETWSSTTDYSYDAQGRLIQETITGGSFEGTNTYDYSFMPFTVYEYTRTQAGYDGCYVLLQDQAGNTLFRLNVSDPQFIVDADGYLAKIVDSDCVFEFYYSDSTGEEAVPNTSFAQQYMDFLTDEAYIPYVQENAYNYAYTVENDRMIYSFALVDVDQDGTQELIIDALDILGWYADLIFTYVDGKVVFVGSLWTYRSVTYSPEHTALSYVLARPAFGEVPYGYAKLSGSELTDFWIEEYDDTFQQLDWMTLDEILEHLQSASADTEHSAVLKAYSAFPESSIGTEQEARIQFSLFLDGEKAPIENYIVWPSDPDVIDVRYTTPLEGSVIVTLKGLSPGSSELTFTDITTEASVTITVFVEDKCNFYRCSLFPIPEGNIGSIFIADYSCNVNENGNHDISFNAYNASYSYGVVEVYNEDGDLIRLLPLEPHSDGSGMEKVVNSFKWVWEDIVDLFNGDTPFYTKEKFAKLTPVELYNIPENAEIVITSDGRESNYVTLYTAVDLFTRIALSASQIDLDTASQVKTVNQLMSALTDSLIEAASREEFDKLSKEVIIKEAAESLATSLAVTSSTDSASDVYETVRNLFQNLSIDIDGLMVNILEGMGYNLLDKAFTTFIPQYKIVTFVDQVLETAWPLMDYQMNLSKGKMEIHVAKHGMQNYVVNSAVVVTQQSSFNENTVLDAYAVLETAELAELSASIPEDLTEYAVYSITLREDGQEIQPNEEIEVRLPVPDNADGEKCVVFRIEDDGAYTLLPSTYDDGYITFTTTHLSYYIVGQTSDPEPLSEKDPPAKKADTLLVSLVLTAGCLFVVLIISRRKKACG